MKENNVTSFEEVNRAELVQVEGGSAFIVGFCIGAVFVAGVAVGIKLAQDQPAGNGECTK